MNIFSFEQPVLHFINRNSFPVKQQAILTSFKSHAFQSVFNLHSTEADRESKYVHFENDSLYNSLRTSHHKWSRFKIKKIKNIDKGITFNSKQNHTETQICCHEFNYSAGWISSASFWMCHNPGWWILTVQCLSILILWKDLSKDTNSLHPISTYTI